VSYPIEEIPDNDYVFYRLHIRYSFSNSGKVKPKSFREREIPGIPESKSMSTDWEKHSTSIECQNRVSAPHTPNDFCVVSFNVGSIRNIGPTLHHDPLPNSYSSEDNQAHTSIRGVEPSRSADDALDDALSYVESFDIQNQLAGLFQWEILPTMAIQRHSSNFQRNPHLMLFPLVLVSALSPSLHSLLVIGG
jgi:hypothetical protein